MTSSYTLPLNTATDLGTVGGKALSLTHMTKGGFAVPAGFCITTDAYQLYVAELQQEIVALARPEIVDGVVSFAGASRKIQALFSAPIPDSVREAILAAFTDLDDSQGVAVRSSATAEDLPEFSFAGQQDTFLNVRGEDDLLAAVSDCWASLWTERAIGYRHDAGIAQDVVAMAVVVQQMVSSDVSGILFTANPTSGARDEMIINSSFGLGEAVVGGEITPDTYLVAKASLDPSEAILGRKEHMIVAGERRTVTQEVPAQRRQSSSLSDAQVRELAELAMRVEQLSGDVPQDIEWAFEGDRLWLLQSRPITNLPPAPISAVWELSDDVPPWSPVIAQRKLSEHIPGPVSPLFEDIYVNGAIHDANTAMQVGFGMDPGGYKSHFVINGYVYMSGGRPPIKEMYRDGKAIPPRRRAPPTHEEIEVTWRDEQVPKYLAVIDKWRDIDQTMTPSAQLYEGIGEVAKADADYWFDGFLQVMLITRGTDSSFHGFLEQYGQGEFTSGQFLTGLPSVAMDAEAQMWEIVQQIRGDAVVSHLVLTTPASHLLPLLRQHNSASDVAEAIDAYLDKYGHEVQTLDFAEPTAGEDPANIMLNLQALVKATDYDPVARKVELATKRAAALERADTHFVGEAEKTHMRSRTDMEREPVKFELNPEFHRMLDEAKRYYYLREEGLYYLATGWPVLRCLALELGRRLTEVGTLGDANEVFYLRASELEDAIAAAARGDSIPGLHQSALERIELRQARTRLRNPPQIPIPETNEHQEESRGMGGMRMKGSWVLGSVQMINPEGDTLEGYACSPGQVTAEASVILSPADFANMKPGNILVCPMTTPAWTHLFSQAAGLVTNVGGILSHGSIVAREYDIPAVLGTGDITDRIQSGQRISVDGTKGVVTILGDSADT
jgi:phosphohistidine swiveling domain-containing protein